MGSRTRRRLVAASVVSALFAALFAATPGVALGALDSVHQPDGRILGGYTTTWKGDNIYNTTGLLQKATGGTYVPPAGEVHKFRISVQNDGSTDDRIMVKAAASGDGWKIQYFHLATNITADVVAGTFQTALLHSGDVYLIKAKLTTYAHPLKVVRLVTLTSVRDATKVDAVKFVMQVHDVDCPPPGC